jgi:hypothetical protein
MGTGVGMVMTVVTLASAVVVVVESSAGVVADGSDMPAAGWTTMRPAPPTRTAVMMAELRDSFRWRNTGGTS